MPVDLSCIPVRAKRQAAPSLKRWVMFLIVLIATGGGITAYFWPTSAPTHTTTFWFCFLGVPSATGGVHLRFAVWFSNWDEPLWHEMTQVQPHNTGWNN